MYAQSLSLHAQCAPLPLQDLVFTPNATTGLNTVIRSCGLKQEDTMYMLDIGWVASRVLMPGRT